MLNPLFLACALSKLKDSDLLVTQDLVDMINNSPNSSFRATLYPQFAEMTIGEAKKFLGPIRRPPVNMHGSPRPVGADEGKYKDKHVFTGYYKVDGTEKGWSSNSQYEYVVYNNRNFCSSWATAVTSAMSLALSIHHQRFVNLSVQFMLDCDILGDPCLDRPPLNAYEQFWRRYIPQHNRWDQPDDFLRKPAAGLDAEKCNAKDGCYPGWRSCPRNLVLTGSCEPGGTDYNCPIYYLYNWRWMKSHLWEVGPVTSSILVYPSFFTYDGGVYSSFGIRKSGEPIGMLDVTIIGWGQDDDRMTNSEIGTRWWYVIPHLGTDFGELCNDVFHDVFHDAQIKCPSQAKSGIVRFNRRFDDCNIESQSAAAIPFNFKPAEYRTKSKSVN